MSFQMNQQQNIKNEFGELLKITEINWEFVCFFGLYFYAYMLGLDHLASSKLN